MMLLVSTWCAVVAARPGNESFPAKAADWARDNHLEWFVNWAEQQWYSRKAPPEGGVPSQAIVAPATTIAVTPTVPVIPFSEFPLPVAPLVAEPIENEGVWIPMGPVVAGHPTMAAAQLRPDAVHTSVLGALVWMDPKLVRFQHVPGTVEPGGEWSTGGTVLPEHRATWLAAFNGGFRMRDARGGFFAEGRESHPLEEGSASFVVRTDGTVDVGVWGRDAVMGPDIASVRQNLALVLDGGQPVPGLDDNDRAQWGHTLGNKTLVWRSGVGVRADGTLIYAASNGLSISTLAGMLQVAGCVRAMELDINPEWVTFNVFEHPDPADPNIIEPSKLLPDMQRNAHRFLDPDSRDFVAVFVR